MYCWQKKKARQAGKLGGWIGQYITISKNIDSYTASQYGLKIGVKYLALEIKGAYIKIEIQPPNISNEKYCWLYPDVFKELQRTAA